MASLTSVLTNSKDKLNRTAESKQPCFTHVAVELIMFSKNWANTDLLHGTDYTYPIRILVVF